VSVIVVSVVVNKSVSSTVLSRFIITVGLFMLVTESFSHASVQLASSTVKANVGLFGPVGVCLQSVLVKTMQVRARVKIENGFVINLGFRNEVLGSRV
jgi:hypothetical protein